MTTPEQPRTAEALATAMATVGYADPDPVDQWRAPVEAAGKIIALLAERGYRIEAQSRPTVASEGLRALLETLVDLWYMDDASDEHMYAIGVAFVAAKAALAAPAPPAGLTIAEIQAILDEAQA